MLLKLFNHVAVNSRARKPQYFQVKDYISPKELKQLGVDPGLSLLGNYIRRDYAVCAVFTGEFRPPRKGEWYLSGAVVEAYKAPNDLMEARHIAKLVVIREYTDYRIVASL